MALTMSTFLGNQVLDSIFNNTSLSYANVYVSLHTGDPADTGLLEVSGGSYARKTTSPTSWTTAAAKVVTLEEVLEYADMPAATVTHIGLWDADTGGNFLWGGTLFESKEVPAGETLRFKVGDISAEIDPA